MFEQPSPTKPILSPRFKYTSAAESAKPGYLREKWAKQFPGCFDRPRGREDSTHAARH